MTIKPLTMILLAITVLFLSSNGCDDVVAPDLQPIIVSFYNEASIRGIPITYRSVSAAYGELKDPILARCTYTSVKSTITVNQRVWKIATVADREYILFHELAHCVLGIDHDNRVVMARVNSTEIVVPLSMMYPKLVSIQWYSLNRDAYLWELFTRKRYELFEEIK